MPRGLGWVVVAPGAATADAPGTWSTLSAGLPAPTLWLDATHQPSLFADVAATQPAVAGGRVLRWTDRRGPGAGVCVFTDAAPAVWTGSCNGRPLLTLAGAGTLDRNPLRTTVTAPLTAGRTVVAVWRYRVGGGGHPLSQGAGVTGEFGAGRWYESLLFTVPRAMNTNAGTLGLADGDPVLMLWERDGGSGG